MPLVFGRAQFLDAGAAAGSRRTAQVNRCGALARSRIEQGLSCAQVRDVRRGAIMILDGTQPTLTQVPMVPCST